MSSIGEAMADIDEIKSMFERMTIKIANFAVQQTQLEKAFTDLKESNDTGWRDLHSLRQPSCLGTSQSLRDMKTTSYSYWLALGLGLLPYSQVPLGAASH